MGWFDEQEVEGWQPYEQGGYAGPAGQGVPVGPNGEVQVEQPQISAPPQQAAPGWSAGPNAGRDVTLLGFDAAKLQDPSSGSAAGSKYTNAAKAFYNGLKQDVGLSRGGLDNMTNYLRANGFGNAKAVGDDKIDFGDGMGPIDVVRSDGQIVFQNTSGNPNWESQGFKPDTAGGAPPQFTLGNGQAPGGGEFGGGNPYAGGGPGGGGYGGGRTYDGPEFQASTIDMPVDYNPQATQGPDAYSPERVSSPDALTYQQIAAANPFVAPDAAELEKDPGYRVRLERGNQAFMANKAMQGVARTGGAAKQLMDYNQDSASQEYGNLYARRFGEYQTGLQDRLNVGNSNNQNAAQAYGLSNQYRQGAEMANQNAGLQAWQAYQGMNQQNQQFNAGRRDTAAQQNFGNRFAVQNANNTNALNAWNANTNAKLGFGNLDLGYTRAGNDYSLGQGQLALGNRQADQSYDLGLKNNALGYYSAGNSYNLGMMGNQLGWANYGLNAQGQNFNQQYSLANMGLNAAGMYGNYAGAYGANAGNNATQYGNAGASGTVGSANAWNAGLGGAYNSAMGAYGAYQAGRQPRPPANSGLYLSGGS